MGFGRVQNLLGQILQRGEGHPAPEGVAVVDALFPMLKAQAFKKLHQTEPACQAGRPHRTQQRRAQAGSRQRQPPQSEGLSPAGTVRRLHQGRIHIPQCLLKPLLLYHQYPSCFK